MDIGAEIESLMTDLDADPSAVLDAIVCIFEERKLTDEDHKRWERPISLIKKAYDALFDEGL